MDNDSIFTYTGLSFYPLNPKTEDISELDIAHALSQMCRANGHFKRFYSVAQHSINCALEAKSRGLSKRIQLACLLHDASEAYISDVARPVKKHLREYMKIENAVQNVVWKKFGLADLDHKELAFTEEIDDILLYYEFLELQDRNMRKTAPPIAIKPNFEVRDMAAVENEFIKLLKKLISDEDSFSVLGIDGCKAGWIAVQLTDLDTAEIEIYSSIEDIPLNDINIALIDIPIGFVSEGRDERKCDTIIRKMLSPYRSSSVFPAPCRKAIYAVDKAESKKLNVEQTGKNLSEQSLAIIPKMREVDSFITANPELQQFLHESHPELCFYMLNGTACKNNKKTEDGMKERIAILDKYINTKDILANFNYYRRQAQIDDLLDAIVLAVTGRLIVENGIKTIPDRPDNDEIKTILEILEIV